MNTIQKPSYIIVLHSVAFSMISYLVILVIFKFVTVLVAQYFDIPSIVHHNKIVFLVKPESWTFDSVKMIFSTGSITTLFIGLICLVIYIKAMAMDGLLKLFFLWGFIHGINFFVGSVVIGAFLYEGMGYVFAWMYLQDTAKMFLLFIGLIVMLGAGTLMVKPMLLSANTYYNSSKPEMRKSFKRQQFFIPYLTSTIILFLFRYPLTLYEFLVLITPGLMLIPLLSGMHRFTIFYFDEKERTIILKKKLLFVAIVMLIMFRGILGYGVRIG